MVNVVILIFLIDNGTLIDDMIFAVDSKNRVLGVPNASMISIMWDWFQSNLPDDDSITMRDLSENTSIIALQGPESSSILEHRSWERKSVSRFRCQEISVNDLGITGWIQGTGYTGEKGVEIFIPIQCSNTLGCSS